LTQTAEKKEYRQYMTKRFLKVMPLIILGLLLPALVSCRPEPVAPEEPRILILEPSADSTVTFPNIIVKTYVDYFSLVDKTGQANMPFTGHIIFYLDVTPPLKKGESALTSNGTYFVTSNTVHIWNNLPAGAHTFWVQLVNNDNTPLEPAAAVYAPVTIKLK